MKKTAVRILTAILALLLLMNGALATTYTVTKKNTRLRSASNMNIVIAKLKKGAKVVSAGGKKGKMIKVKTSGGKVGYIYSGLLSKSGSASKKSGIYTKGKTGLYKNSNGKPVKVGALKKGVKVKVLQTKGKWSKIKTSKGNIYYVMKSNLKKY